MRRKREEGRGVGGPERGAVNNGEVSHRPSRQHHVLCRVACVRFFFARGEFEKHVGSDVLCTACRRAEGTRQ